MSKKTRLISMSMFSSFKSLALLVLVITIAIIINVAFAYRTPKNFNQPLQLDLEANSPLNPLNGTEDWEVYTDPVGKFSIKSPPGWILEEGVYVYPSRTYWEVNWRKSYEMDAPWMILGVWENPQGLSASDWLEYRLPLQGASRNNTAYESIVVAGSDGLEVTGFPNGGIRTILVSYQSRMYEFTLGTGSAEGGVLKIASDEDEETFNLMMNSLHFLE